MVVSRENSRPVGFSILWRIVELAERASAVAVSSVNSFSILLRIVELAAPRLCVGRLRRRVSVSSCGS